MGVCPPVCQRSVCSIGMIWLLACLKKCELAHLGIIQSATAHLVSGKAADSVSKWIIDAPGVWHGGPGVEFGLNQSLDQARCWHSWVWIWSVSFVAYCHLLARTISIWAPQHPVRVYGMSAQFNSLLNSMLYGSSNDMYNEAFNTGLSYEQCNVLQWETGGYMQRIICIETFSY